MDNKILLKYKNLILLAVVVLISAGIIIVVLVPQIQFYFANRDKAPVVEAKAQLIQKKVTDLNAVDQGEVESDLKVVLTVLPKDQNVTDAVTIMQNLAALSGLGITQLGYSNSKGDGGSFRISMGLSGQVTNLNNLLKQLNQSSRIVQVESISLDSEGDSYNISVPFVFYFKPVPSGNVPEDQSVQKLTDSEKALITQLTSGTDLTRPLQSSTSGEIKLGKDDPFN